VISFSQGVTLLITAGTVALNQEKLVDFYNELQDSTQQLATAGDLRQISQMLDYHFMTKGRYPSDSSFGSWMATTFKENALKSLTKDSWGNELIYRTESKNKRFILISPGKDGLEGTDDDLKITGP